MRSYENRKRLNEKARLRMTQANTLLNKLWSAHEITTRDDGTSLLWVDRHLVHEGSHHAFAKLASRKLSVAQPALTFAVADHYVPTINRLHIQDATIARMINTLENNAQQHSIEFIGVNDPRQGIVHVIGPEQGLTLPGLLINCGDSHTSTHGAFGALAFGIGATEVAHVLATQTLWQKKPKAMRINIQGTICLGVTAKDIALHWIAKIGNNAARGHAIEYAGSAIDALSMEARMTLCNMSIEGGARFGLIAPDETTYTYIKDRPYAPSADAWALARNKWQRLTTDKEAVFDREITINANTIGPTLTWGISPNQAIAVDELIPMPADHEQADAQSINIALEYMGLEAGQPIKGMPIDQVFIGSCTNARIEDIRSAALVLKGKRAKVPGMVSPGSSIIKAQAEQEGLHKIFIDAGLNWVDSGCSSCVAMNGDIVAAGKRCASTTNRNFRGRQGRGSRTHIMSPAMVAAAAVYGKIVDIRTLDLNEALL